MLTALIYFLITAIIIVVVAYCLILLWDWACGMLGVPAPLGQIVRVVIMVIAVVAILLRLMPVVSKLAVSGQVMLA